MAHFSTTEPAKSYDVIIAGSGVAGVSAALTAAEAGLSVAMFEKDSLIGGGTCLSYGGIWVGCSHLAAAERITDTRQAVLDYMRFVAGESADDEMMQTFIDASPAALEFFDRCGIKFQLIKGLPDHYYPVAPGSIAYGRTFEPKPISLSGLGELGAKIRDSFIESRITTIEEFVSWGGVANQNNWDHALIEERLTKSVKTGGPALIAHFMKALTKYNLPIFLNMPVEALESGERGIVGVRIPGGRLVRARKGVVLATGGWEGDAKLAREFEGVPEACSPFPRAVSGDGWKLAVSAGASTALIRNNLAIMLGFYMPPQRADKEPEFRIAQVMECQCPHTIIVNSHGERFSDESYFQDTVHALRQYDIWQRKYRNAPSYLIFDSQYVEGFSFCGKPVGEMPPEWVSRGVTIGELADKLAINRGNLQNTIARFNEFARQGVDRDFHRGEKHWNTSRGEAIAKGNPLNRRLGTLERGPFFGIRLFPGVFASSGGVRINKHGQAVDTHGNAIPRLYVIGNAAAHLEYGIGYQAGSSLTSGMTFGYLAMKHIMSEANAA